MDSENVIRLSGPFTVTDSTGRAWDIHGIRIYDEGYGIIDVYVDLVASSEDEALYEDALLIAQIMSRLHALGYVGPDFGPGDPGQQDDRLIVLEAPEEFGRFAASKGWRNLAEEYAGDEDELLSSAEIIANSAAATEFYTLMRKLGVK